MDFNADLKHFYSDCAQLVTVGSDTFFGFLKSVDQREYETVVVSTHTLRYPDARTLATNDLLTIDSVDYKVAAKPERINTRECVAYLVRQ